MLATRTWKALFKGVHVPPTTSDLEALKPDEAWQDGRTVADVFGFARAIADYDFELANEGVCGIGEGRFRLVGGENKGVVEKALDLS